MTVEGEIVYAATADGALFVFETRLVNAPGEPAQVLDGAEVTTIAIEPSGDVLTGTSDGELRRWTPTLEPLEIAGKPSVRLPAGAIEVALAGPSGELLMVLDGAGVVDTVNLSTGTVEPDQYQTGCNDVVTIAATARRAYAFGPQCASVVDLETGKTIAEPPGLTDVLANGFQASDIDATTVDGKDIVVFVGTNTSDGKHKFGRLNYWEPDSGTWEPGRLTSPSDRVLSPQTAAHMRGSRTPT